jgi:alginate O-acetyltransferase complex protein AlgI
VPFNSLRFLGFLAAAAAVHAALPARFRAFFLLAASYAYYAAWSPEHALLLLAATAVAYGAARRQGEAALYGALIALLGALAICKYGPGIAAPIGISYYTFKLVSYVVDVHWGRIPAEKSFTRVAVYGAFFPQIPSGPIARAGQFLPELAAARAPGTAEVISAARLILFGFFEKAVVADRLAAMIDAVKASPGGPAGASALFVVYAYCWRLYADFSGITHIAIGAALLFGLGSPRNFKLPFYAGNIQEFWRRWHISLTSWLTDYVFLPARMALRDRGTLGLAASIMVTMLLIGVWHGPALSFVVFGLINGAYMVVSALTLRTRDEFFKAKPALARARALTGPLLTFNLIALSFAFFQSATPGEAAALLRGIVKGGGAPVPWGGAAELALLAASVAAMEAVHLYQAGGRLREFVRARPALSAAAFYAAMIAGLLLVRAPSKGFIYFRF